MGRSLTASRRSNLSSRHGPWVRWVLYVMATAAVAYGAAVIAANVLLARTLARLATGELRLAAEPAFSWVPGRLELRRVRVAPERARWVATADAAQATLSLGALLRGDVVIQRVSAALRQVSAAPRVLRPWIGSERITLESGMRVELTELRIDDDRWQIGSARLVFQGSTLRVADDTLTVVHGEASFRADSPRAQLRLTGGETRDARSPWTLDGSLSHGLDAPVARLRSERDWAWKTESFLVHLSAGSSLTAETVGPTLKVDLHVPRLSLARGLGAAPSLVAKALRVDFLYPLASQRASFTLDDVHLRAEQLELDTGTQLDRIRSPLDATLDLRRKRNGAWRVDGGTVSFPALVPASTQDAATPLAVLLVPQSGRMLPSGAISLRGRLEIRAQRLDAFFSDFRPPEAARLVLAPFAADSFRANARFFTDGARLDLDAIELSSTRLQARGFLHRSPSSSRGALVVKVPLGALGLSFVDGDARTIANPPKDWLTHQQDVNRELP